MKLTVCGLFAALSVTVSVPVLVPGADGVNVTLIAQLVPAATDVPQLFVCAKSPDAAILDTVTATELLLAAVTVCNVLVV